MSTEPTPRAYFVFHGHFYQPPRENPWTDEVDREPSARPFHDWNARIDHECYRANGASALYDAQGRVLALVNNYAAISFNFGPTLVRWLERHDGQTLQRLREADSRSRERHAGHGNAIAQAYNHPILALADERDVRTQVRWGLVEFEHRFGRSAEGIWLPETACNRRVLDILAEEGVRFVVLAPRQARRVRPEGAATWQDVSGDRVDPSRAYFHAHRDGSQRRVAVFFYDGPLAQTVSFGGGLKDGTQFAASVERAIDPKRAHAQLVHLAVDGETAGHHVPFGNLALSYALERELEARGLRRTNYGEYLDLHPPTWQVEIDEGPFGEGTSWSCAHGVGRWIRDCSCRIDPSAPTQQGWRTHLRRALDVVRDAAREWVLAELGSRCDDAQSAIDDYVRVLLHEDDRERVDAWLAAQGVRPEERDATLARLELWHLVQLSYTSCGWFFDDIGGLESVQVLRYAGRAIDLWRELGGDPPEAAFLAELARARSNDPRRGTGADVYRRDALAARVSPERVAAHLAMVAVVETPAQRGRLGLHVFERLRFHSHESGSNRVVSARFALEHRRTRIRRNFAVWMLHGGALEFVTAVTGDDGEFDASQERLHALFDERGPRAVADALRSLPGAVVFGAEDLLQSGRRRLLEVVFQELLSSFGDTYAGLYAAHRPTIATLHRLGFELPEELLAAMRFTLRRRFERDFLERTGDAGAGHAKAAEVVREAARHGIEIDSELARQSLSRLLLTSVEGLRERLEAGEGRAALADLEALLESARSLRLDLDLGSARQAFWSGFLEAPDGGFGAETEAGLDALAQALGFAPGLRRDA